MQININTDAFVEMTNKLERMGKSALPLAVRSTLNTAAFDVKQNTMPRTASKEFEKRQPNFFKANSRVEMAKGFNVSDMKAMVGFTSQNLKGQNNQSVEDLQEQEKGGNISGRSFIPIDTARSGNSRSKNVRPINRLQKITNIVSAKNAKGKNDKQKFVKSVVYAGKGGLVLAEYKGKMVLWRVNSLKRTKNGNFKLTALYSYDKNRDVRVGATHFMERASLESAQRMPLYFYREGKKQIDKLKK